MGYSSKGHKESDMTERQEDNKQILSYFNQDYNESKMLAYLSFCIR